MLKRLAILISLLYLLMTSNIPLLAANKYNILIIKSEYLLELREDDVIVHSYRVGLGKNPGQKMRVGDMTTPTGDDFYIEDIVNSSRWTHDFKDGKGEILDAYGPWFLSIETPWEGIGIHGTHKPESIGTMDSEGCIRMYNDEINELKQLINIGTRVRIIEQRTIKN